jgi:hypothetical protein
MYDKGDEMCRTCSIHGEKRDAYRVLVPEILQKRPKFLDWIIVKWILEKQYKAVWIGLIWLRIGTSDVAL